MTLRFLELDEPMIPFIIMGTCGMKQTGKSLYSRELGFHVVKQEEGEILWLSTEEPTDFMFTTAIAEHEGWDKVFIKKYGVEPIVHWVYLPNAEEVMRYAGIDGRVVITEGEEKVKKDGTKEEKGIKLEFKILKVDTDNSPLAQVLAEHDIRYIVLDSLTTPFDQLTMGGRQNFAIRSQTEESFLNTVQNIVYKAGMKRKKPIYIMTTNHITNNPTDPFTFRMIEKELVEKGGKMIGHYTKILYGFKKKITPHGAREVWVMRFPNLPEFGKSYEILITNEGIKRTSAKELATVKETQKAERQEAKEA